MNLREVVLTAKNKITKTEVEGFEGAVFLKEITIGAFNEIFNNDQLSALDKDIHFIIATFCNENGELIFTPADFDAILNLPLEVYSPLAKAVYEPLVNNEDIKKK